MGKVINAKPIFDQQRRLVLVLRAAKQKMIEEKMRRQAANLFANYFYERDK